MSTEITPQTKNRKQLIWGIVLLAGPTALWIITFLVSAMNNWVHGPLVMESSGGFSDPSPVQTALNIVSFIAAAVALLTWLPGIIIGIILLATRKTS